MFSNVKVGVRLGLCFGVVVALMCIVAWTGIHSMGRMHNDTTFILKDRFPMTEMAGDVAMVTAQIANALRDRLLGAPADAPAVLERIDALRKENNQLLQRLDEVVTTPKGKDLLAQVHAAITVYRQDQKSILDLAAAGQRDAAAALVMGQAREHRAALTALLIDFQNFVEGTMREAGDQANKTYEDARNRMFGFAAAALLVAAAAAFWVTRSITGPLNEVVGATRRMSEGDLTVRIKHVSKDEMGDLARATGQMIEKLSEVLGEVGGTASSLSSASDEISSTAQSLAQASNQQAASVEQTSASVEQMSASIKQNSENARITDQMAGKASHEAEEGGQAVTKTVEAMKQIAQKISIIDDIAYQTNLLALNAAIEAARAGEHGKGFAVVAAEVRNLAERSQVAAREIGEVAKSSVQLAEKAGSLLNEIVPSIKKTSDLVQEIAAAGQEQSSAVGQINTAMTQLSQLTQQNATAGEELAATSEGMSGQARLLTNAVAFFKLEVSRTAPRTSTVAEGPVVKAKVTPFRAAAQRNVRSQIPAPESARANGSAQQPEVRAGDHNFVRF